MMYAIAREPDGLFLQGIAANEKYASTATAPTTGARHCYSEYSTVWGGSRKGFERLTAANYVKTIFEEFRWEDMEPFVIKIIPIGKEATP